MPGLGSVGSEERLIHTPELSPAAGGDSRGAPVNSWATAPAVLSSEARSSKEQGEVEGSRSSNSPGSDLLCEQRVPLSPQAGTRGACPASCRAECARSPSQTRVLSLQCCLQEHTVPAQVRICLSTWGIHSHRAVTREEEKATKQLKKTKTNPPPKKNPPKKNKLWKQWNVKEKFYNNLFKGILTKPSLHGLVFKEWSQWHQIPSFCFKAMRKIFVLLPELIFLPLKPDIKETFIIPFFSFDFMHRTVLQPHGREKFPSKSIKESWILTWVQGLAYHFKQCKHVTLPLILNSAISSKLYEKKN